MLRGPTVHGRRDCRRRFEIETDINLVSTSGCLKLTTMEKPWYRRMFSTTRPSPPDLISTRTKAEGGDAAAQFFLGVHYSCYEGAAQDLPQAAQWYRRAAVQNHSLAQLNLGLMLEQGLGAERDTAPGQIGIRRAADAGDAGAQFNCGNRCYREMIAMTDRTVDVARLRIEGYVWFQLAAAQGYRGSDASRNRLTVWMTHAEVAEANQRVARFVPATVVQADN